MKVKTSELKDAALAWAVAKAEGLKVSKLGPGNKYGVWLVEGDSWYEKRAPYNPGYDWAQGGPIIDEMVRDGLRLMGYTCLPTDPTHCQAQLKGVVTGGPTLLIAAMRCFVSSNLGDEVEVPDELY